MSLFKVTSPAKITRLRHSKGQSGQALAEVALILALICVVTIVAMAATGTSIDGLLDSITAGSIGGDVGGSGGGGTEGALSMSAGTTQGALVNLADDGTISAASSIGANTYRVLSMSGTTAKLLKMQDIGSGAFNGSSVTTSFNGTNGQKYEGSNLDSVMNTFYENLPAAVKAAIVPQTIKQSMYSWSSGANASSAWDAWCKDGFTESTTSGIAYNCNHLADITVGERYVYALDVDDIVSYFQAQGLDKTPQNLTEMFWDVRSSQSKYVWLRSASSDYSGDAFYVDGTYGYLDYYGYGNSYEARPAFIINIAA